MESEARWNRWNTKNGGPIVVPNTTGIGTHGHNFCIMDELPPAPTTARFYYRFVDCIGFGSCDVCYRIGPQNHICLHCCVSEGMELGSCFVCNHRGPAWEDCQWCEGGRCLVSGYGECNNEDCEWYGPLGHGCSDCGEGVFTPVPLSHLFSNSAEVTLQVALPTTVAVDITTTTTTVVNTGDIRSSYEQG